MLPPEDGRLEFRARVPNGDYLVWLCAGPVIRKEYAARHFLLRANDEVLFDDLPPPIEYYSRKYLYRFLNTRYSEKPHALWANYIDRMYPVHTPRVKVTDGTFTLEAENYFVSAVVLVPASAKDDFDKFAEIGPQIAHRGVREDAAAAPRQEAATEAGRRPVLALRTRLRHGGPAVDGADGGGAQAHRPQDGRGAGPDRDAAPGGDALRRPRKVYAGNVRPERAGRDRPPTGSPSTRRTTATTATVCPKWR